MSRSLFSGRMKQAKMCRHSVCVFHNKRNYMFHMPHGADDSRILGPMISVNKENEGKLDIYKTYFQTLFVLRIGYLLTTNFLSSF